MGTKLGATPIWRICGVAGALQSMANFYEKAHFVKPTWRLVSVAEAQLLISAPRAMLLFALSGSLLLLGVRGGRLGAGGRHHPPYAEAFRIPS